MFRWYEAVAAWGEKKKQQTADYIFYIYNNSIFGNFTNKTNINSTLTSSNEAPTCLLAA